MQSEQGIYGGNFRNGCDALFGRHVVGFLNNCNIVCSCAVTLLRFGSLDVTLELYGVLPNAITFMKRDAEENGCGHKWKDLTKFF